MRKDNPRKDDKSKSEKGIKARGERFNKGSSNLALPKWDLTRGGLHTKCWCRIKLETPFLFTWKLESYRDEGCLNIHRVEGWRLHSDPDYLLLVEWDYWTTICSRVGTWKEGIEGNLF